MEKPKKRKNLPTVNRDKVSENKVAKISTDLFLYGKTRWRMGVHPFRLVCMVAQTLSSEEDKQLPLFQTEYSYSLDKVFYYLGLEKNKARYNLLFQYMEEAMGTVISYKSTTKKGKVRWKGLTLISYCDIDEESGRMIVQPNERAREYLVGMKRWCALQPKYYLKLSSEYQNWFYMFLKKEAINMKASVVVDIETIKYMLCLDEVKSYNAKHNKNANENFFKRVLGIVKPKDWKYKSKGINTPWDYMKEEKKKDDEQLTSTKKVEEKKKGRKKKEKEFSGTLAAISQYTDINVSAFPIKEGRSYTKICFEISRKTSTLSKSEKEKLHEQLNQFNIDDMGKPERSGRSGAKKPQTMADIFASTPVLDELPNPMSDEAAIPGAESTVPSATVREMAKLAGKTPYQFAKELGYEQLENGDYKKKQ
jgi:hypothetical protein